MNVISEGRSIDRTLQYERPKSERVQLGQVPADIFLETDQTPPPSELRHQRPVVYDQPLLENGQPVMETVENRFQASAPNPIVRGLIGGFVGGVVGVIAGGFTALLTQNGAFLVGGALTGLVGGTTVGALGASGQRVRLVEKEIPIEHKTMTGMRVEVTPGRLHGQEGFFHRFEPDLQVTSHGTYQQPVIERYREGASS